MARRERTLTTPETIMGQSYNKVRIIQWWDEPQHKKLTVSWQCGYLDSGEWTSMLAPMARFYNDTDYDTLIASGADAINQWEAIQDQVFADLETDGSIGAGTEGDY